MAQTGQDAAWLDYQRRMDNQNLATLVELYRVYAAILVAITCCAGMVIAFLFGLFGAAIQSGSPGPANVAAAGGIALAIWILIFGLVIAVALLNFLASNGFNAGGTGWELRSWPASTV